jgi:mono/diheme cytochrome c family protein
MSRNAVLATLFAVSGLVGAGMLAAEAVAAEPNADAKSIARGKYLTRMGGCNDCHTPGWDQAEGKVPEADWLVGSPLGFKGPWGTTYPSNLRLALAQMTEAQWLVAARQPRRPLMPWYNLRDASDDDLRAIYRFVRSLGPKGTPAPAYAAPGVDVPRPYFALELPPAPRAEAAAKPRS